MNNINDTIEQWDDEQEQDILYEHHRFIVDKGQGLLRIDKFLNDKLSNISRNKIQDAANTGNIKVNGNTIKPNYRVKPQDIITIELSCPKREIEIIPQNIPLNIVYEDDTILIVNKKPDMVVHPGLGNYTGTLVNALTYHLKDNPIFNNRDDLRPGLVHRIDKFTSGLIVIAKTEHAKTHLARQFFEHTINRKYHAIVWGRFEKEIGTINGHIARNPKDRKIFTVFENGEQGKHAITHYKVLENLGYVSLVECTLETGRTHQIRVHMRYIKHPVFNDAEYGGNRILKGTTFNKYKQFIQNCFNIMPRQALHAKSLGFIHPNTEKYLFFDSQLPEDMKQVIEKWRNYTANRQEYEDDTEK